MAGMMAHPTSRERAIRADRFFNFGSERFARGREILRDDSDGLVPARFRYDGDEHFDARVMKPRSGLGPSKDKFRWRTRLQRVQRDLPHTSAHDF